MGCHTWYNKLITNNQEEIIKRVRDVITVARHYDWYEFTNLKDLFENDEEWVQEIAEYVYNSIDGDLIKVNGVYGIYEEADGFCIDSPRIGNYPTDIITSAEEMFKVMEEGLVGYREVHSHFYWNKEDDEYIRKNIIEFFKKYPDGIITFG